MSDWRIQPSATCSCPTKVTSHCLYCLHYNTHSRDGWTNLISHLNCNMLYTHWLTSHSSSSHPSSLCPSPFVSGSCLPLGAAGSVNGREKVIIMSLSVLCLHTPFTAAQWCVLCTMSTLHYEYSALMNTPECTVSHGTHTELQQQVTLASITNTSECTD